jgi:hypothetical protein
MLSKYRNKYLSILAKYQQKKDLFDDHKIYEILWALEKNYILWDDLPPDFEGKFDVPHCMDYGIDLVNLEYTETAQVKKYCKTSTITWSDMSKFYTYSKAIMHVDKIKLFNRTPLMAKDA